MPCRYCFYNALFYNYLLRYSIIQSPTAEVLIAFDLSSHKSSVTAPATIEASTAFLINAPSSISEKAYSNIMAAYRMVAHGLAIFNPAAWG